MKELQQLIRAVLLEGIEPGEYADLSEMALLVDRGRYFTAYTLYKPEYYAKKIKKDVALAKKDLESIRFKDKDIKKFFSFANLADAFRDDGGIYGYMEVHKGRLRGISNSCYGANEIIDVNAKDGYGTFMFDIAIHRHSPVMPNRKKMSKNASKLWTYYATERKDVKAKRFKNEKGARKTEKEDCELYGYVPLDQAYTKEKVAHIQNLENKHHRFIDQMKKFLEDNHVSFLKTRVTDFMTGAGEIFLSNKEEDGGWVRKDVKSEE